MQRSSPVSPPNDPRAREGQGPARTAESRVGALVRGKWRLDELLGVGGMAAVYAATHQNGRRAALKILHPELSVDPSIRERFVREGYVGNKIQHPGGVEVHDNDTTDEGEPFLVMELLIGETLDHRWKREGRKLPLIDSLSIAAQLLDFLAACHAAGVIHRDLKPANIFLCDPEPNAADETRRNGRVKVLDYGIAQLRDAAPMDQTRAGTTLGTPSYMSPEQARGLGDRLDGRADIFSVGALLYALTTGSRLHQGRSNDEALVLAATQPAPSLARADPDLPPGFIALVDKALQWDRRNRWENASEMRVAVLAELARQQPPPVPAVAEPSHSQPRATESSVVSAVSAVSAVSGVSPVSPPSAVSQVTGPTPKTQAPPADEDPRVTRLRSVGKAFERVLPSVRQYAYGHPETERRQRALFEEVAAALADPCLRDGIVFSVRPYAFALATPAGARDVWEPAPPFDTVPYAFFESGVRELLIHPGVTEPELRALVELFLVDPARDLPPEDDLATRLWDLGLPHVEAVATLGFADGDADRFEAFFAESDELERLAAREARAARAEANAMAISTDEAARGQNPLADALGIDRMARLALGAQLSMPPEKWRERFVDVLSAAILDARRAGDLPRLVASMQSGAQELLSHAHAEHVLSTWHALVEVLATRAPAGDLPDLRAQLTDAFFGETNLTRLLAVVGKAPDEARPALLAGTSAVLELLGEKSLPNLLEALDRPDEGLKKSLLGAVERLAEGHERWIASELRKRPQEIARELLAILGRKQTADAVNALADVAAQGDLALRLDAIAERAVGTDQLKQELSALVEHARLDVRLSALRMVAERKVRELGPWVLRRVEDPAFHALALDERRALLEALMAVNPARAEALAIEIVGQRAMLRSEARDQSRLVAAQVLGAHAKSKEALEALGGAGKGWWRGSDELRDVAAAASSAIRARIEGAGR